MKLTLKTKWKKKIQLKLCNRLTFFFIQGENSRFRIAVQRNDLPYDGFTTLPGEGQIIQGSSSVTITVGDNMVLDYEKNKSITFQVMGTWNNASLK